MYQPKTGQRCQCRKGVARDNCPNCESTGWIIDFAKIRARHHGLTPVGQAMINPSAEDMANMETLERNRGRKGH